MLSKIKNFKSVEQLYNMKFIDIPENKGIYIVKKSRELNIEFSLDTAAIKEYRNKSMIYDPDVLLA
jgi:hypothetical protein